MRRTMSCDECFMEGSSEASSRKKRMSYVQKHESIFRFFSQRPTKSEGVLWPNARARSVRSIRSGNAPYRRGNEDLDVSQGEPYSSHLHHPEFSRRQH